MNYRRTAQFKIAFEKLPSEIKEKAYKAFLLFQQNPHHPYLSNKFADCRAYGRVGSTSVIVSLFIMKKSSVSSAISARITFWNIIPETEFHINNI
jgi:hypothetical protein